MMMLKDASNEFIEKGANLTRIFNFDEYVVCGITAVSTQKLIDLTMKGPGFRKLRGGRIIEVGTHKVPRIIGKSGSMVGMIKALGAEPVELPYGQVTTGLATGLIDGAENNWPSYVTTNHYKLAPYYTLTEHTMGPEVLVMSLRAWESLSPEDRQVFRGAARESSSFMRKIWTGLEERSPRRALLTRGAEVDGWEILQSPQDVHRLHDVNDLLVEGGSATATAFLAADLVDRILIYRAPILVGGAPPHAIRRAVRFGDGWMSTGLHADRMEGGIASLRQGMAAAGKPAPEVVLLQALPVDRDEALAARLRELAALGVTRVVHPWRYETAEDVARVAARLVAARGADPSGA